MRSIELQHIDLRLPAAVLATLAVASCVPDRAQAHHQGEDSNNPAECVPGERDPVEGEYMPKNGAPEDDGDTDIRGVDDRFIIFEKCGDEASAREICKEMDVNAEPSFVVADDFVGHRSWTDYSCELAAATGQPNEDGQEPFESEAMSDDETSNDNCIAEALQRPALGSRYEKDLVKWNAFAGLSALNACAGERTVLVHQEIEVKPGKFARNSNNHTVKGNGERSIKDPLIFKTFRKYSCEGKNGDKDGIRRIGIVAQPGYTVDGVTYTLKSPYRFRTAETRAEAKRLHQTPGC